MDFDPPNASPRYTLKEEIASSVIHGIGIILALSALIIMVSFAIHYGSLRHVVGAAVFGSGLLLAYTSSTLYHSFQKTGIKELFRTLDHVSIFVLIAATYTPLTLVNLHGPWGWSLLGVIWSLALFGTVLECTPLKRYRLAAVILYLGMGWTIVGAFKPLLALVPRGGLQLLLAGGVSYTVGVLFYVWRRLPYNHAVWHLFVLAGSACHFFAVLLYVLPYQ
ncbi:MAG: hemolysin III family protein [Deltaproteobacteria bacterium]|nr:hemolysin III family protein [Deltaproteobacteria bacterium]